MNKLHIDLTNCYGIKELKADFDFSKHRAVAIYAANGAMKSSLAQTFKDIADGNPSKDRIFPGRKSSRKVTDERGADLTPDCVLVVRPYDEVFGHTEKTSTLLVDAKLRKEYEQLHVEIDKCKQTFLKAVKEQSGSKKDLEQEIASTFTKSESDDAFYRALLRIKEEVLSQKDAPFANIDYDTIFDEKVLSFLGTKDFKSAIEDYIKKLNELLSASTYFRKGTFNYYNATTIAKSLSDNGFFDAKHSVKLNADETIEITSVQQLEELIAKEKEGISKDKDLRKKFAEIEKLIQKNANMRDFEAYLSSHEELLPKFANIEGFREDIWKSYCKARLELFVEVIAKYQSVEKRKREIEEEAGKQRTQWEAVIDIFNERFFVPFKLSAKNKVSVILGQEPLLTLGFTFEDGGEKAPVEKKALIEVLSTGEKKALYVLNIIFEIEARKQAQQETVFVIDDLADSFDYKNKYAIIEYLREISEDPTFSQVILTHNFDFFRTINSRFVSYSNCFMAFRTGGGLTLKQASGIKNVFVNDWKQNFFKEPRKKIASIAFMRNIVEYTKGSEDAHFLRLTSLLHWKEDSMRIVQGEVDDIFNAMFGGEEKSADREVAMVDIIRQEANACLKAEDGNTLENKIVLAIATRMAAEEFMVKKIDDVEFTRTLETNQTARLFTRFRERFENESKSIGLLQRVILMTPESIHLNSFMYEPILDMSDEHLKSLYQRMLTLGQ